ncbi:adenine deaminase [Clostridium thailandense]|uniref:adenine deaminase n=1 Tax=Clostridium thailandense TaxID=2794346 RepID=UPI003989A7BC
MNKNLINVTKGIEKAELAITNGKIVNVYSKEIYNGGVAVYGDKIAAIGDIDYTIGPNTKVIDAKGKYLLPGFIDGHIHPESTNLSIRQFAEIVLTHGTTVIMADMHEVGVVGGISAIDSVLKEAENTPLKTYFVVPSHVPFSPNLETSGGHIDSKIVKEALKRPDAVGLSEIVSAYVLSGSTDLMSSIDLTIKAKKSLQGHMPETLGPELQTCIASGIMTDHESLSTQDALERIRLGCHLMMREGSVAHNLVDCLKVITEHNIDSTMCSIVTDDLHTTDAVEKGHLDESIRIALSNGIDFITAVQMVTLNAARAFNLDREIGSLAPGRRADINITTGPEKFSIESVIAGGKLVVENTKLVERISAVQHDPSLLNTIKLKRKVTAEDFIISVDNKAKFANVKAMRTLEYIPITIGQDVKLPVSDGIIQSDTAQDVIYISQVERYGKNGNIGKAFMAGFNLKNGAIASTIGHDNHNIIVLGTNHGDMALAVNRLAEIGGGQIVVNNNNIVYEIPLPILGLLSDKDAWSLSEDKKTINALTHSLGSTIGYPFMFLSFISLAAIPEYAITDHGFIDVAQQKVIDPIIGIEY